MSLVSSRGTVNSLDQRTGYDRLYKPASRKGVLAMYGVNGTRDSFFSLDASDGTTLRDLVPTRPVASLDVLEYWGNSTIRTNMSTLKTNAQVSLFASGKVHLMGISAGATCALNWAKANPTLVQSILLIVPAVDIQDIYDNWPGGLQDSISSAYGGRPSDANNPADNTASFTSFPIQIYYSTTDTVCTPATITAFASGTGAELVSMGAMGHFWNNAVWNGEASSNFFLEND